MSRVSGLVRLSSEVKLGRFLEVIWMNPRWVYTIKLFLSAASVRTSKLGLYAIQSRVLVLPNGFEMTVVTGLLLSRAVRAS